MKGMIYFPSKVISLIFTITFILTLSNCTNEQPTQQINLQEQKLLHKIENKNTNTYHDSTKVDTMRIPDDNGNFVIVEPLAQSSCIKDVDYWIFEKYIPVPDKIVGIWPTEERWSNVERIKELKEKWGFNYIFTTLGSYYDNCLSAGYLPDHMLGGGIDVYSGGYRQYIQSRPALWGYYTDEPVTNHGAGAQYPMSTAYQWFKQNYPNSLFISGETTPLMASFIIDYIDIIFCTRYCVDGDYFCIYPDQRPLWTDFKNAFEEKFSMTWIGAHKDLSQYDDLIGHAKNLGLKAIWLYQYQDDTDISSDNNISSFALYAWKWGWLKRVERKWIYTYECINQNPCDCDPYSLGDEWILINKYPTRETRTIDY